MACRGGEQPQPCPLGLSSASRWASHRYASLPFKQMRKCSSSLCNDLFGPEPGQVYFQWVGPRSTPPSAPALHCHPARHLQQPKALGTKVSFQTPTPTVDTYQELITCPQRHPNPCDSLLPGSAPELSALAARAGYPGKDGLAGPLCLQEVLHV